LRESVLPPNFGPTTRLKRTEKLKEP
jgi:hypothetical protein